ncbi:hypothetical protein HF998_02150 [Cellulomonas hominis]|uniref:Uncharacterized protein n=1 Tax=Cellulomonas hominis TaxID=156981 RepID=A0A7W8WCB6_9CELL|nr:hypothetical protein [Cellulomonas hominis]MBB5474663.1 hypothetical protein [Cellulomonas hominis]NKY05788.1 hypothetical protein [Cellulomonas hominis]
MEITGFYVSVRSGPRRGLLLGPFATQEVAEAAVELGRECALQVDELAACYEFGTAQVTRLSSRSLRPGLLNRVASRRGVDLQLLAS